MQVMVDRYLRSCDLEDLETGPMDTWRVNVPIDQVDQVQGGSSGRRLHHYDHIQAIGTYDGSKRKLLQPESVWVTGVLLRVRVNTNTIRVESEVNTIVDAINTGSLANDLTTSMGSEVNNASLTQQPATVPFEKLPDPNANSGGSLPGWIIGTIVGAILILMPIPIYLIYKRRRRQHLEALEKQAAEAAAARQRMQSRVIKSGGKSFLQHAGGTSMGVLDDPENGDRMESLAGFSYAPSIADSVEASSRRDSVMRSGSPTAMGMVGRAPSVASTRMSQRTFSTLSPEQQQSFLRYQSQSLGGVSFLPSQHGRSPSNGHSRQLSGAAVFPAPYISDETSSSSGNNSDPRPGEK